MPQVDFYILPEDNSLSPLLYTVRLVEKAFRLGHRLYVHTTDAEQTRALNEQLWQRDSSFLAHATAPGTPNTAIMVSHQGQPGITPAYWSIWPASFHLFSSNFSVLRKSYRANRNPVHKAGTISASTRKRAML